MASGLTDKLMETTDLVAMIDEQQRVKLYDQRQQMLAVN